MLIKFRTEDVEIVYINNEPYFKAKDVCSILGFKNHHSAVKTHCDLEGVASAKGLTITGEKISNYINEQNLYALIFNVPKKFAKDTEKTKLIKDKAKDFQKWVFKEVLPTLRKTGKYEINKDDENNLLRHLDINIQKQNVKMINSIKFKQGGVESLRDYHNELCKVHTGKTASEIKKIAKETGKFKSKVYNSAREVIRSVDKSIAASMSVTDQLAKINKDKSIKEIYQVSKLSIPLFQALEKSNLTHNFEELNK